MGTRIGYRVIALAAVLVLLLAACTAPVAQPAPAADGGAPAAAAAPPTYATWEEVLAAAEGTTVNWYMWGGSDKINADVDNDIGKVVQERAPDYSGTRQRTASLLAALKAEAKARSERGEEDT